MADPTYDKNEIQKNKTWRVAFILSELYNNSAPLGWSRYIPDANVILASLDSFVGDRVDG